MVYIKVPFASGVWTVLALVGRDRKTLNIDSSLNWFGYKGTRVKESETFLSVQVQCPDDSVRG